MRIVTLLAGLIGVLASGADRAAEQSAQAILEHARSVYAVMSSYSDTGSVLQEYGPDSRDMHRFSTFFSRAPRYFLFDMHKQGGDRMVIWGDPDAYHVWWKATGQTSDYPNPKNTGAISLNEYPTDGVITKIPTLLYSKAPLSGALTHFEPTGIEATEPVGGQPCYRLAGSTSDYYEQTGKSVNIRKLKVWIDTQTYLIRRVLEEGSATPGSVNRTTTTYEPKANAAIPPDSFKFTPPK